jgi:hypothetical protein
MPSCLAPASAVVAVVVPLAPLLETMPLPPLLLLRVPLPITALLLTAAAPPVSLLG